jgi:hypothetical protein
MGTTFTTHGIPRNWLGKLSWIESVRSQPPSSVTPSVAPINQWIQKTYPELPRALNPTPGELEQVARELWASVPPAPKTLIMSQRTTATIVYWDWRGTWFGRITRASGFGFIAALYAAALVKGLRWTGR